MVLKHRQKKDGTYHVYIRVTHKTKVAYIATEYHVTSAKLNKYKEIIDSNIINACRKIIAGYENEILRLGSLIDSFTVSELVEHLTKYRKRLLIFSGS
jgi:hypothetical protein